MPDISMNAQNFTTSFTVDQTPEEVFAAITNVRGWWSGSPGIEGRTDELGNEFTYCHQPYHYSKQQIIELTNGRKVAWRVMDSKLSFVDDNAEWTGTEIIFEIARRGDRTEVRFTHIGLTPTIECFDASSESWASYVKGSLRNLITSGEAKSARSRYRVS
jgi:hypothetical protein